MPLYPLKVIANKVPGLDLWQRRDWPFCLGDTMDLSLGSSNFPGRRHCCGGAESIDCCMHENVHCWKCKGTFCLPSCVDDLTTLATMPLDRLIREGFANCHACQEPLRSIGLVGVFRHAIEMSAGQSEAVVVLDPRTRTSPSSEGCETSFWLQIHDNNPVKTSAQMNEMKGVSLVMEAEYALTKAEKEDLKGNKQEAILEYTHAINAINYLASLTNGKRLVLRAHDILLRAHAFRAYLENKPKLVDAILKAYPKASVRTPSKKEASWYLSRSAFRALFYPLPAKSLLGTTNDQQHQGEQFLVLDIRTDTRGHAMKKQAFLDQMKFIKDDLHLGIIVAMAHINNTGVDGNDARFDSLNGTWRGSYLHLLSNGRPVPSSPTIILGGKGVNADFLMQHIWAFPTDLQAKEYARIVFEAQDPTSVHPQLAKQIKTNAKEHYGVKHLHKAYAFSYPNTICVMAAVGNVATNISLFISDNESNQSDGGTIALVGRALLFLENKLVKNRSSTMSCLKEALHHPDLTMCAYCGESKGTRVLMGCARCRLANYCNAQCQKKHWKMKGPFSHKNLCSAAVGAGKR